MARSTLAEIAREKAGIFKRGAPAIVAPQDYPEAETVLRREAESSASKLVLGRENFHVREENGRLVFEDEEGLLDLPLPRLAGRHQHINAATAIATLRTAKLAPLGAGEFERGLLSAEWPARLQRLTRGKLVTLTAGRRALARRGPQPRRRARARRRHGGSSSIIRRGRS